MSRTDSFKKLAVVSFVESPTARCCCCCCTPAAPKITRIGVLFFSGWNSKKKTPILMIFVSASWRGPAIEKFNGKS